MNPLNDVIAAIATPIGEGGISVIRVSGKNAIEITDKGFRGKQLLSMVSSHTAHFGTFLDTEGNVIDEVIATVFREPHSYTAENSVEISCHGGMFVTNKILDVVLSFGARLAEPGEFTKRAFLNGRIDLSQAEAVADVIQSRSERSHQASMKQLQGMLSKRIADIREKLLNLCGLLELELDFVEDGYEFTNKSKIANEIKEVIMYLNELVDSFKYGKVFREGVRVVLAGKPNVGKSSVFNYLLSENRAIVTDVPGTTRDVIEEAISIDGVLFNLVDTAGLRISNDVVEMEGIRRTNVQIRESDVILFLFDANDGGSEYDTLELNLLLNKINHKNIVLVLNKVDLLNGNHDAKLPSNLKDFRLIRFSAKTGLGIDVMRKELVRIALGDRTASLEGGFVVTSMRHRDSLISANNFLLLAQNSLLSGKSNEFIAVDIRSALNSLGEIIGIVTSEDILNGVFSKFCIGK